jgi:hypothetical protein
MPHVSAHQRRKPPSPNVCNGSKGDIRVNVRCGWKADAPMRAPLQLR